MEKWEDTTKSIINNGDMTDDFILELAKMVDRRDAEINRLQVLLRTKHKFDEATE